MVKSVRGRKASASFGYSNEYVKTEAFIDGEWRSIGMSKRRIAGATEENGYLIYTLSGTKCRQAK